MPPWNPETLFLAKLRPYPIGYGKYLVKGRYTLKSPDRARLYLYRTTKKQVVSRTYPSQVTQVRKGTGDFSLEKPIQHDGYLHLSFYPAQGGGGLEAFPCDLPTP